MCSSYLTHIDKTLVLNEKDKKLYHDDILTLEREKQSLIWTKEVKRDCVYFTSEFKISNKPINNLKKTLMKFIPISIIIGFLFALIFNYRKDIISFLNK